LTERDIQNGTARAGHPQQERQNRIGRTGQAERDIRLGQAHRIGRTEHKERDRQNWISRTEQAEQDRQNRPGRTGQEK
jgi:hypothetical protein